MILTSDYKPVFAAFDTPSSFKNISDKRISNNKKYTFSVGLFEYIVHFLRTGVAGYKNIWMVAFTLKEFHGDLYDLQEYLQGVYQREISLEDAETVYMEIKDDPMGDLNLRNEKQVFSTLFQIIKEFVKTVKPNCIFFSGTSPKKQRVYQTMVRRFMPGWVTKEDLGQHMIICQKGES